MGRRRLWIIVGTAIAAVAVVLALALLIPRQPFPFLDGQEPISLPNQRMFPQSAVAYCWQADHAAMLAQARPQLLAKGFSALSDSQFERYPGGRGAQPYDASREEFVLIIKDKRPDPGSMLGMLASAPGYVTVVVKTTETRSLWDRIKAVFGL